MRKYLTQGVLAAAAIAFGISTAMATDITGAGATFPYPIYAKWAEAYKQKTGVGMNYQSIGSGGGIAQIKAKTVDFGASDMPLKPEDLQAAGLMQFPAIIGGVVPVVNIEGVAPGAMKFSGPVLADIYLGKIKKWNEKPIAELNPSVKLPDEVDHRRAPIGRLRDDLRLDRLSVEGQPGMEGEGRRQQCRFVARRRGRQGQRRCRGVRAEDQGAPSGTSSTQYAKRNKMAHASVQNKEGQFVQPDDETFQAAAAFADWKNAPGFYQILTNAAGQDELADHERELHSDATEAGQAAERRGSAQVLRLVVQERPENGRGARLRADARSRREADCRRLEGAAQGWHRQADPVNFRHANPHSSWQ